MNFVDNDDLIIDIFRSRFRQADNIRITEKYKKKDELHLTSKIIELTIEYQQDGKPQSKHLVLKVPNTGRSYHYFAKFDFYTKEARVYDEMIPRINDLTLASAIPPVHYFTTDCGILMLENLAARGYVSAAKRTFFDLEPNFPILQALAQFHAATYKIHRDNVHILAGAAFDRTVAICGRQHLIDPWQPVIVELLERTNCAHLIPKVRNALSFLREDDSVVYGKVRRDHFKFVVLNHGDFRRENLLFRYDATGRVENVKFVDFQTCWWSTPAFDFLVHLVFSVRVDVVENHFETLVHAYLQYLNAALHTMECWCDYTDVDFMQDVKRLHFVIISCLLARCTFGWRFDHSAIEDAFMVQGKENGHPYRKCLEDELFVHSLAQWLKFCEKLGVFRTIEKWTDELKAVRNIDS